MPQSTSGRGRQDVTAQRLVIIEAVGDMGEIGFTDRIGHLRIQLPGWSNDIILTNAGASFVIIGEPGHNNNPASGESNDGAVYVYKYNK